MVCLIVQSWWASFSMGPPHGGLLTLTRGGSGSGGGGGRLYNANKWRGWRWWWWAPPHQWWMGRLIVVGEFVHGSSPSPQHLVVDIDTWRRRRRRKIVQRQQMAWLALMLWQQRWGWWAPPHQWWTVRPILVGKTIDEQSTIDKWTND
jgi:hypothetical protein